MGATGGKWSFAMYVLQNEFKGPSLNQARPRTNMDALKGKVPASVWNQCYRARCAHMNALEGFPLFAAAMVRFFHNYLHQHSC